MMPASNTNIKEEISIKEEKISILVRSQDDRILYFKINGRVKLSKMFTIYCERRQLEVQTVRFLYEGNRITGDQTADGLGLEDGAEICAFVHQTGGRTQQHGRRISC